MRVSVLLLSESVQEEEDSEIKMKYIAMAVEIKSFKCATTARFMRLFFSLFLTFQFNPYAATQHHYVLGMKNTFFTASVAPSSACSFSQLNFYISISVYCYS